MKSTETCAIKGTRLIAAAVAISPNLSSPEGEGFQPSPMGTLSTSAAIDGGASEAEGSSLSGAYHAS